MAEHGNVKYVFAAPGALTANWVIYVELDHAFMPRHVSAVTTNDSDATVMIGLSTDTDSLMTAQVFGDSGDPAEYGPSNFADADEQFAKGAIMVVTIDYDGDGGTAGEDPCVVISGLLGE